MCGVFPKAHNPQLLAVRERISILEPNDVGALLDYIEAALMFQQPKLFRGLLLNRASVTAKDNARYYHLLSISDFLANDLPQADAACQEAIDRNPTNKEYRVNQAIIRLSCPDPGVRQAALESLDSSLLILRRASRLSRRFSITRLQRVPSLEISMSGWKQRENGFSPAKLFSPPTLSASCVAAESVRWPARRLHDSCHG